MVLDVLVRRSTIDELVPTLHREHHRELVRLAGLLLHDRGAGEEVVRDAFVRLHTGWRRPRDPGRAVTWLRRAVLDGARGRQRHAGVGRHRGARPAGAAGGAADDPVAVALGGLPDRQREAVVLCWALDVPEPEAAAALGTTTGRVQEHLDRALPALHALLAGGTDDDLLRALREAARRHDPPDDGWRGIALGVEGVRHRRRLVAGALSVAAAVALVAGITLSATGTDTGTTVEASRGDTAAGRPDPGGAAVAPPAGPGAATSVPPDAAAPAAGAAEPGAPFPGIWPFPSAASIAAYADADTALEDPVATAAAFARDYLGMVAPHLGDLRSAGGDEGEVSVEVRPASEGGGPAPDGGPLTTVRLRPYPTEDGDRVWTVVDARSANIVVDEPAAAAVVGSPLAVRGSAAGHDGTVVAEVRQDGMRAGNDLGRTVGVAGAPGQPGPVALEVAFDAPVEPAGALVVTTDSGTGGVPEATVVRIAFAPGAAPPGPPDGGDGSCAPPAPDGGPGPDQMDVRVFLVCPTSAAGEPRDPKTYVGVTRRVPLEPAVLRAALVELLRGATDAEAATGLQGVTDPAPGLVREILLEGGAAVVDLAPGLVRAAPGADTSTGRALLRGALDRTVLQFPTVESVEYRLGGSCEAWWAWHRIPGCPRVDRPGDTS